MRHQDASGRQCRGGNHRVGISNRRSCLFKRNSNFRIAVRRIAIPWNCWEKRKQKGNGLRYPARSPFERTIAQLPSRNGRHAQRTRIPSNQITQPRTSPSNCETASIGIKHERACHAKGVLSDGRCDSDLSSSKSGHVWPLKNSSHDGVGNGERISAVPLRQIATLSPSNLNLLGMHTACDLPDMKTLAVPSMMTTS